MESFGSSKQDIRGRRKWNCLDCCRYFTPSGQCIHDIGIEPDIKVELAEEYKNISPDKLPFDFDDQLQRALMEIEDDMMYDSLAEFYNRFTKT